MFGGPGADLILGGAQNDTIRGGRNPDCAFNFFGLVGGPGNDKVYGGRGNDCLSGGPGIDELYGGRADDRIDASESGGIGPAGDVEAATLVAGDYVNCGPGFDRAIVDPEDTVVNCEDVEMASGPFASDPRELRARAISAWMAIDR